jgi:hypothetical protein
VEGNHQALDPALAHQSPEPQRGIAYMANADGIKMHRDTRAYDRALAEATEREMSAASAEFVSL